jgi:hypothetical protein
LGRSINSDIDAGIVQDAILQKQVSGGTGFERDPKGRSGTTDALLRGALESRPMEDFNPAAPNLCLESTVHLDERGTPATEVRSLAAIRDAR